MFKFLEFRSELSISISLAAMLASPLVDSSAPFSFIFLSAFKFMLSATTLPARLMLPLASRSMLLAITRAEAFAFLSFASFLNLLMLSFLASYKPSRIFAM